MKMNLIEAIIWFVCAMVGTSYGWLPGHWAILMVLLGAVHLDRYAIQISKKNKE